MGDFQDIMRALLEMTPAELERLVKKADGTQNKQTPAWILMLVSQINMCIRYGRTDALMVLDRVFGKATQKVENEVTAHVVGSVWIEHRGAFAVQHPAGKDKERE